MDGSALPWLLVTCKNLARNRRRKEARRDHVPLEAVAGSLAGSGPPGDEREELRWVVEDIARLGELDQELITACLIEGRSYSDAAAQLGLNPAAARQRIHRARANLLALKAGRES